MAPQDRAAGSGEDGTNKVKCAASGEEVWKGAAVKVER